MKRFAMFGLLGVALATGSSHATILTFDVADPANYREITTYGTRVGSTSDADGSYLMGNGFTPNVVASYRTIDTMDQSAYVDFLYLWTTDYGDLENVAFAAANGYLAEITLTPDAGFGITLNSFDLAGWPWTSFDDQPLTIYDANYKVLLDYSPIDVAGAGGAHTHVAPVLSHNGTIHIRFSDNWSVGIDNINFDQYRASAVPEPATFASAALAAVAGLAALRRRRAA